MTAHATSYFGMIIFLMTNLSVDTFSNDKYSDDQCPGGECLAPRLSHGWVDVVLS